MQARETAKTLQASSLFSVLDLTIKWYIQGLIISKDQKLLRFSSSRVSVFVCFHVSMRPEKWSKFKSPRNARPHWQVGYVPILYVHLKAQTVDNPLSLRIISQHFQTTVFANVPPLHYHRPLRAPQSPLSKKHPSASCLGSATVCCMGNTLKMSFLHLCPLSRTHTSQ